MSGNIFVFCFYFLVGRAFNFLDEMDDGTWSHDTVRPVDALKTKKVQNVYWCNVCKILGSENLVA